MNVLMWRGGGEQVQETWSGSQSPGTPAYRPAFHGGGLGLPGALRGGLQAGT